MDWISVEKQMPPEDVKVLGLHGGGVDGAEIVSLYWSKQRGWYSHAVDLLENLMITYWCEFPYVPEKWWE